MEKILIYGFLFILGLLAGFFYFTNLWKSVNQHKENKSKLIFSSFLRFPIPIIAAIIGGFLAGVVGIIIVIFGFSVFQIFYLVKKGSQLKKDLEEYAKTLEEENKEKDN
ncbi:ATP synthase subunit I [Hydrogenothermus marinus]|uniref:F1-F0 ATPase (N-ATPase) AtpR subunit n=1 Tax=Hydrogenothermus marinus TaxID=133270 RepID=A0A3M0BIP7_9AQUI|nr:ATP synthase subunit I [Hydrogenothermus marinus]RMA97061.1 F1-F0 ATPase (N-ATPase) AtpR subunit [Hydrogenothermus marinus]